MVVRHYINFRSGEILFERKCITTQHKTMQMAGKSHLTESNLLMGNLPFAPFDQIEI